jgi:hypothetical protein
MKITLDNKSNFALASNPATLGDVLIELTQRTESQGRAIQVIILNGKDTSPEELTVEAGQTLVSEIGTLAIHTADMSELVMSSLDEISIVIPEMSVACHELAQILAGDNPASCFGQFNQFLDIWDVLKEREQQAITILKLDAGSMVANGQSVFDHNATLDGHLQNARKFMEASKFPELADLLSHDLAEAAEVEEDIIAQLKALL